MARLRIRLSDYRVQLGLVITALVLLGFGLLWGTVQPWSANHFGYALSGRDGLPTYVYENGRRYHSEQVCAGAGWCASDRVKLALPRCYTQADLQVRMKQWPLVQVDTMHTFFGDAHPILQRVGERSLTVPFIVADGADCYVVYGLEGGP